MSFYLRKLKFLLFNKWCQDSNKQKIHNFSRFFWSEVWFNNLKRLLNKGPFLINTSFTVYCIKLLKNTVFYLVSADVFIVLSNMLDGEHFELYIERESYQTLKKCFYLTLFSWRLNLAFSLGNFQVLLLWFFIDFSKNKEIVSFHIHLRMDNGNNFYRLADGWIDETQMFIQIYFFVFLVCISSTALCFISSLL